MNEFSEITQTFLQLITMLFSKMLVLSLWITLIMTRPPSAWILMVSLEPYKVLRHVQSFYCTPVPTILPESTPLVSNGNKSPRS